MNYVILLIGLAVLTFGCVVQPAGPLEENIKPPEGLDVKKAFEDDSGSPEPSDPNMSNDSMNESNETMAESTVGSEELSRHNSTSDCWVLYEGEVYDVTAYLLKHPGGSQPISDHCGKADSSFKDAFEGQHGTSKIGGLMQEGVLKGTFSQ